jgi:hypothetical protein
MTSPGYGPGYPSAPDAPPYATTVDDRHPVHFSVDYPQRLSRGLIFVKWLLIIPHIIVLYALSIAMSVVVFIAWFAILFTGRYPLGLFNFVVGVQRWSNRVSAYGIMLVTDKYPPFRLDE